MFNVYHVTFIALRMKKEHVGVSCIQNNGTLPRRPKLLKEFLNLKIKMAKYCRTISKDKAVTEC